MFRKNNHTLNTKITKYQKNRGVKKSKEENPSKKKKKKKTGANNPSLQTASDGKPVKMEP